MESTNETTGASTIYWYWDNKCIKINSQLPHDSSLISTDIYQVQCEQKNILTEQKIVSGELPIV